MNKLPFWVDRAGRLLAHLTRRWHRPRTCKIVIFTPGTAEAEADRIIRSMGGRTVKRLPLLNGVVCELDHAADLTALAAHQQVTRIDDDLRVQAYPFFCRSWRPAALPQPAEKIPWGVSRVGAPALWEDREADLGAGVSVAVLDTGVDLNHPDLSPNLAAGVNILNPRRPPKDDNGHGTHVAGIIAAARNGIGVAGAAPRAQLHPVKVLDKDGGGRLSDVVQGLEWCIRQGIRVVNLSLGSPEGNPTFAEAVRRAAAAGIVLVAAAGNSGPYPDTLGYPARYPRVIAVGATTEGDRVADFSSRGEELDLVAPGSNIPSTWLNGSYRELSGTSMAAPHVAGLAALLLAREPGLSPDEVKSRLRAGAVPLPGWPPEAQGAGLVNGPRSARPALLSQKAEQVGQEGRSVLEHGDVAESGIDQELGPGDQ